MSRSGGMTTEISSSLTAAGLGVSTAISIGGDAIIGSTYAELMPLFESDDGDRGDRDLHRAGRADGGPARRVDDRESSPGFPIVAFMAGKFMDDEEMKGMSFGHAGTIVEGSEDTATEKIARLEGAGIRVVERIDEIPDAVKEKTGGGGVTAGADAKQLNARVHRGRGRRRGRQRPRARRQARGSLPGRHLRNPRRRTLEIVDENLDECVLCELCIDAAPDGTVRVKKLYDGTELSR